MMMMVFFWRIGWILVLLVVSALLGAFIAVGFTVVRPPPAPSAVLQLAPSSRGGGRTNIGNSYQPTDFIYESSVGKLHGKYKNLRSQLDYEYHKKYSKDRVRLQDAIIDGILDHYPPHNCTTTNHPWVVFMAGAMGAGKSHTIRLLHQQGHFPLDRFVVVDPDQIRRQLPEYDNLVRDVPERAGEYTRKESGLMAEILVQVALQQEHNVLVDGSLRDGAWYKQYIQFLRDTYPNTRLAILHVMTPRELVLANAANRAKATGRVVPHHRLEQSLEQVPRSVEQLRPLVDACFDIHNSENVDHVELVGNDWRTFQDLWVEKCGLEQ